MNRKPFINLRIFRRTQEHIYLAWDVKELNAEQKENVTLFLQQNGKWIEMKYETVADISSMEGNVPQLPSESILAAVDQNLNKLDKEETYNCKLLLGKDEKIEYYHKIYPYKTFPLEEKDQKRQNSHLFGWDENTNRWHKLSTIKVRVGKRIIRALPVVIMDKDDIMTEEEK